MNKWFLQQEANITAFQEDDDFVAKRNFFFNMCKALDNNNTEWNLFCSCSLFFAGITDEFNDFDLLVSKPSFEDTKCVLKNLGLSVKREEIYGMQIDKEISKEDASLLERFFKQGSNQRIVDAHNSNIRNDHWWIGDKTPNGRAVGVPQGRRVPLRGAKAP